MADCCSRSSSPQRNEKTAPCCCGQPSVTEHPAAPQEWFARMIPNCLEYARQAKAEGRPIVGIQCEYTPRELILAAGGVPVCLCGGSAKTIPDAEQHLPVGLCPLIKSTFGYHVQKSNPFLEMADLIVAETTCDGKKKMYELMAQSRPMYVLELPCKSDDPDAAAHWQCEMGKLKAELERRFRVEITPERLREAIRLMNRERSLRRRLAEFMAHDPPPLTGRQLLDFKSSISGIPDDLRQYEAMIRLLEAPPCATKGPACHAEGRNRVVRVLLTGVPIAHGAERVLELIEAVGGVAVAMESCTGLKPILQDVDENAPDPLAAIADKYLHLPCSVMTPNAGRFEVLRQLAARYHPQCVMELTWQNCLTYDVEARRVRRFAEEELHLPYLQIVTDYSPADSARIRVRIEALYETVRNTVFR